MTRIPYSSTISSMKITEWNRILCPEKRILALLFYASWLDAGQRMIFRCMLVNYIEEVTNWRQINSKIMLTCFSQFSTEEINVQVTEHSANMRILKCNSHGNSAWQRMWHDWPFQMQVLLIFASWINWGTVKQSVLLKSTTRRPLSNSWPCKLRAEYSKH